MNAWNSRVVKSINSVTRTKKKSERNKIFTCKKKSIIRNCNGI